jgi:Holliday junction resolvase-like predicted endonuclease
MSTGQPTFDDIWRMFQETERRSQETERMFQETERRFQESDRRFQETERLLKESSLETERWLKEQFKETDQLLKAQAAETKRLERLFVSQWGRLMESLVEGDLVGILTRRGVAVQDTSTRLKGKTPSGESYEFDILAHNGEELVVVEVKTTLKPKAVKQFIAKLDQFKGWLPRYANNQVYGAMAYLTADAGAEMMAENRGLFVIRATGDSASIINAEGFRPRGW